MQIINVVQGSPEWHKARCGIPSASNFDKIITIDGKPSKTRQKYVYQCVGEKIAGITEEGYTNSAMQRGIDLEAEARSYYELVTGVTVEQVGFCMSDGYGASPDGMVGNDGLLEIKCPTLPTHVGYLLDNKMPGDYFQQVQGQLLVTGRKWCDFVSYYPAIRPLIIRVERDEKFIAMLKAELDKFCSELNDIAERIRNGN